MSNFGFNNMDYRPPCTDLSVIPADTMIDENAAIDTKLAPEKTASTTIAKKPFPWWLLVITGYILYKEQQG